MPEAEDQTCSLRTGLDDLGQPKIEDMKALAEVGYVVIVSAGTAMLVACWFRYRRRKLYEQILPDNDLILVQEGEE